jgi:EAL domain-containing protein (putative c-di-GMP-specific phosphodiesterase class I)
MLTDLKKGAEKKLLDVLARLRDTPVGYYVCHFKFSELPEHYKNDGQLRISVNVINDILGNAEGYVGITSDHDLFVICKNSLTTEINKAIFQLRYLYMDDALAYDVEGKENEEFCRVYELRFQWERVFAVLKQKLTRISERETQRVMIEDETELTPAKLVEMEAAVHKTNIAGAVRAQPVCILKADGFKHMFDEIYINMSSLSQLLRTSVNLTSDRWLFKYLTQVLDRKMLEYMAKTPHKHLKYAMSMNLNVTTLLSESFIEFDKNLTSKIKQNIIIEIQASDVLADMQGFAAARQLLQEAGYRICIDGLTSVSFVQIDRNELGFDLAKMFWNADIKVDARKKMNQKLADAVEKCGKSRVILARCDNQDAIYYGQALGISLYQGRFVDAVIDPNSDIIN